MQEEGEEEVKDLSGKTKVVEELVEVEGQKMKRVKKYVLKLQKNLVPKGVINRSKLIPFGVQDAKEASRLDKNPVFFAIHGKGKQIKVRVDTLPKINQQLKDIEREIEGEKVRMRELDAEDEFGRFQDSYGRRELNENAAIRVSSIPDAMTVAEIREIFEKYGKIVRMAVPKPMPFSEEQKRAQKRAEKRTKRMLKRQSAMRGDKKGDKKEKEKEKKVEEKKEEEEKEKEKKHRGFAFIYYSSPEEAQNAIQKENDKPYYSQIIGVKKALPRRPPAGGF